MTTIRATLTALAVAVASCVGGWWLGTTATAHDRTSGSTPPSCVRALDLASEGFDAASDATDAAQRGDRRAADDANDRLESIAPEAGAANRACRRGE